MIKVFNIILLFISFLFTVNSGAQTTEKFQDSIKNVTDATAIDSIKALQYYDAAVYAIQPLNNLKLSRTYVDSSMQYARIADSKFREAQCHFLYGLVGRLEGNYDKALAHLDKNIEYFNNDPIGKSYALFQVGVIYDLQGDYENSLKTFFEIERIFEQKKDSFALASTYNSIALMYGKMKKNDEALKTYNKALVLFQKLKKQRDIANTSRDIGEMYLREFDTIKGKDFLEKSLSIAQSINEDYEIARSLYALSSIYTKSQKEKGLSYINNAKDILEKGNYKSLLISVNIDLGHYYKNLSKYQEATIFYNDALKLAEELEELPPKEKIFESLSFIYKQEKNYNKAYEYLEKYTIVKDSLLNIDNQKTINLLQKQFETEKNLNQILSLSEENLKKEATISKKDSWIKTIVFGSMLVGLLAFVGFIFFRQKSNLRKQQAITETMAKTEIKEQERISRDLHDSVGAMLATVKNQLLHINVVDATQQKQLTKTTELLTKTANETRRIAHNLIPEDLTKFGLINAIENTVEEIAASKKMNIDFVHFGMEKRLDSIKELHLYRIVQELFQNLQKHAQATTCTLQFTKHKNELNFMMEDNGIGFQNNNHQKGAGLQNIQSRVQFLKGKMYIDSKTSNGTSININIPLT